MMCDYCNKEISKYSCVYKGYDCTFCSSICRNEIANINYINDPKLCEFKKWYKYKDLPLNIEITPKRTESIIEFENRKKEIVNIITTNCKYTTIQVNEIYDYSYNYKNIINKFKFVNFLSSILYIKIF